jgi:hypothetical protein
VHTTSLPQLRISAVDGPCWCAWHTLRGLLRLLCRGGRIVLVRLGRTHHAPRRRRQLGHIPHAAAAIAPVQIGPAYCVGCAVHTTSLPRPRVPAVDDPCWCARHTLRGLPRLQRRRRHSISPMFRRTHHAPRRRRQYGKLPPARNTSLRRANRRSNPNPGRAGSLRCDRNSVTDARTPRNLIARRSLCRVCRAHHLSSTTPRRGR